MSTLLENLERLETAKTDIAEAIVNKGVKVAETDGLESFAEKIDSIEGDGLPLPEETATIGDRLFVSEVDTDGKPIKWTYKSSMDKDIEDLTYEEIARIVRAGIARYKFKIGDQITTTYTAYNGNQYEMPWDIVAFREVELEDGSIKPGMIIQSHYATVEKLGFDTPEPSSPNAQIQERGYNRWLYSDVRQWLNSNEDKGSWWTASYETDTAPTDLNVITGFMKGLPTGFINMIKPVKHKTALNYIYPSGAASTYVYDTTYDMFFLPSYLEEFRGLPSTTSSTYVDVTGEEGAAWEYWIQRKNGVATLPNVEDLSSIRYWLKNHDTPVSTWTCRSCHRGYAQTLPLTINTGNSGISYYSSNLDYVAPAAVIC